MKNSIFPIFLDNNATTPRDPRVRELYSDTEKQFFGNPSSNHIFGWQAEEVIRLAKEKIALCINADPELIIFTSGASEANNLAIRGFLEKSPPDTKIVTSNLEHSSISETVEHYRASHDIIYYKNSANGYIDFNISKEVDRCLITTQHSNNEIGTIQDVASLPEHPNCFVHIDCVQSLGKIPIDLQKLPVDCISLSAHKVYGPVGIGALVFKSNASLEMVRTQISGGSQQKIRSGTLPTALIAAFGEACKISHEELDKNVRHMRDLAAMFFSELTRECPHVKLIGEKNLLKRLPGNLSLHIPSNADTLISKVSTKLALSKGSACFTNTNQSSRVLTALGLSDDIASHVIRVGIGKFNTRDEIIAAASIISAHLR